MEKKIGNILQVATNYVYNREGKYQAANKWNTEELRNEVGGRPFSRLGREKGISLENVLLEFQTTADPGDVLRA